MTDTKQSRDIIEVSHPLADSPCLQNVPDVPTARNAMLEMTQIGRDAPRDLSQYTNTLADLPYAFVPTLEHARILIEVVNQVRESYFSRNLNCPGYRHYTMNASEFLHRNFDRSGHRLNLRTGRAPLAISRGIFVCAQAQMGRQRLAAAIEQFLGLGVQKVRVHVSSNFVDFLQLRSLRICWPSDGRKRSLVKAFVSAFDASMNTSYSGVCRGPLMGGEEDVLAICALATAANLGLLIVERINSTPANFKVAMETWDALGVFTRTTGIPVLCLATPGAALALAQQSGSLSDLVPNGVHRIKIPSKGSDAWKSSCELFFRSSLKTVGIEVMPDWFVDTLWVLSRGRYGVAAKACSYVARNVQMFRKPKMTAEEFLNIANKGLALDIPFLKADELASKGGTFRMSSVKKHGDWLSFENVITTMPGLQIVDEPILVS
nr:hypothetical protein [uncultured Undibacterium sp.]